MRSADDDDDDDDASRRRTRAVENGAVAAAAASEEEVPPPPPAQAVPMRTTGRFLYARSRPRRRLVPMIMIEISMVLMVLYTEVFPNNYNLWAFEYS
jgi:hypothetical protein